MKCNNCGNEIKETDIVCNNCGANLEKVGTNNSNDEENNKRADQLTDLAVVLVLILPILSMCLIGLSMGETIISLIIPGLILLAGLTVLLYVRVKYPKHKKSKELVISIIVLLILGTILFFGLVKACDSCIGSCMECE